MNINNSSEQNAEDARPNVPPVDPGRPDDPPKRPDAPPEGVPRRPVKPGRPFGN